MAQMSSQAPMTEMQQERRHWLGLLARARPAELAGYLKAAGISAGTSGARQLRAPEVGAVMVRGRAGATGAPFNLGEMTVTRCALGLADGRVGHGYVQGRDKSHAEQAALVDALMQGKEGAALRAAVLEPLEAAEAARREAQAARAAATKVDFFTMMRGED